MTPEAKTGVDGWIITGFHLNHTEYWHSRRGKLPADGRAYKKPNGSQRIETNPKSLLILYLRGFTAICSQRYEALKIRKPPKT